MAVKSAKTERIETKIIKDMHTDIEERPNHIRNWFSDNIISKSLSYLVGLGDDDKFHVIRVDTSGNLKVSGENQIFTYVKHVAGSVSGAEIYKIYYGFTARRLMFHVYDGSGTLYLISVNDELMDFMNFESDVVIEEDIEHIGIGIMCEGGNPVTYEVTAFAVNKSISGGGV